MNAVESLSPIRNFRMSLNTCCLTAYVSERGFWQLAFHIFIFSTASRDLQCLQQVTDFGIFFSLFCRAVPQETWLPVYWGFTAWGYNSLAQCSEFFVVVFFLTVTWLVLFDPPSMEHCMGAFYYSWYNHGFRILTVKQPRESLLCSSGRLGTPA